ncbi:methyltransferase domain-containing protein [Flavobacterium subsaxonicum]|uniref:Nodulation protein NoeA n=1 Tax=Flavobacterium subsaxonicum WB 4.1-42 = DSM 21790 TaxID=1121898 RepID=A0A0A2MIW0_9FLAO|nr:class I SAM-dependent methyltransferase [Flavobacterium subsaxonicum]KGO92567.1 nodulation protein NoeA [Flavobacterium subsaxonicum WB 4.1-42 = DSM 21790]
MTETTNRHASSFRDPSGYILVKDGVVFRNINPVYFNQYQSLTNSGFYKKLFDSGLLVKHTEVAADASHVLIQPENIPFFSYPYEWSFTQYKHAALHTLKLQKYCLQNGYTLKDATAFNITFNNGAPVFVDTLSFDVYTEGEPWRAYKQFLMHFFGPLLLAKYYGNDMLKTLQQHIDGMPLQKVAKLLPFTARFNATVYTNIFLTAKYDAKYSSDEGGTEKKVNIPKASQLKIIDSLYNYIKDLTLNEKTEWKDYYAITNYDAEAFEHKKQLVKKWYQSIGGQKVVDLGGNDGTFSRVLKDDAKEILVTDIDPNAVDYNYQQVLKNKEHNLLPLVSDLLNPAPGIGFNNKERAPLQERIANNKYDVALALALIHHISLSGNVPFAMSAQMFASLTPYLIIEFPDREDSWVSFLLKSKREFAEYFDYYNRDNFEKDYAQFYTVIEKQQIPNTHRTLYLLKRK